MFTGSGCFPSLMLYITCCPPSDVIRWEDLILQCPEEYLEYRTEECCGAEPDRADFVFKSVHLLAESTTSVDPTERSFVLASIERLLVDYDHSMEKAWHMLVFSTAADVVLEADRLKDDFKKSADAYQPLNQAAKELLPRAQRMSRRLAKAALRLEAFASFLRARLAVNSGRSFPEVEHEEVYPARFDNVLMNFYKLVVTEHDELAYTMIPTLQESLTRHFVAFNTSSEINLLVVNLGQSAKLGLTTLWSILRYRTQTLRVFVLGDAAGIKDWKANLQVLENSGKLRDVKLLYFEYLEFTQHPKFQKFMSNYPAECDVNEIGEALLARFICHDLLPADVHRVIAMDLADVLVLEDIKDLWAQFDTFEQHHIFAAAHIPALSHVNGGLALYDLSRMRASNWTSIALKAARDGLERSNDCIHDQSLMNTIHLHRQPEEDGLSPMKTLPCRWMLVPTTEWQMFWNTPEMTLPEVQERRRYPGLVGSSHFEVYCPDALDLLSGWTFLLSTSDTKKRLRTFSLLKGSEKFVQCSRDGTPGYVNARDVPKSRCCVCGEKAALVHIPGDMKQWAFVDILFRYHSPFSDWQVKEMQTSLTKKLWQKESRFAQHSRAIQEAAGKMSELYGGEVCFKRGEKRCCSAHNSLRTDEHVVYRTLNMKAALLPFRIEVESTAAADAHVMMGTGPWNSLEIIFGASAATFSAIRWLNEGVFTSLTGFDGSPQKDADSETWKVQVQLDEDGRVGIRHGSSEWGFFLPDNYLEIFRQHPAQLYVGVPGGLTATWTVCREELSKKAAA